MTAVAETFAVGEWVVIGPNITRAPVGAVGRVMSVTPNDNLIVETAPGKRHVVPPDSATHHAGPPPGRELRPFGVPPDPPPAPVDPLAQLVAAAATEPPHEEPRHISAEAPRLGRGADWDAELVRLEQRPAQAPRAAIPGTRGTRTLSESHKRAMQEGRKRKQAERAAGAWLDDEAASRQLAAERAQRRADELTAAAEPERQARLAAQRQRAAEPDEPATPPPADATGQPARGRGSRGPMPEAQRQAIRDGIQRRKAEQEALAGVEVETLEERDGAPVAPAPALRLIEPATSPPPARTRFTAPPDDAPRPAVGVHDALRWAIAAGAEQRLSVGALRLLVDTLEAVEAEVLP